jgi:prophage regulatory protein
MTPTSKKKHRSARKKKWLRLRGITEKTGLSYSTLFRLLKNGELPPGLRISTGIVVWDERVIDKWMTEREAAVSESANMKAPPEPRPAGGASV